MTVYSTVRRMLGLTDTAAWTAFYGGESWAGKTVTAETAMQLSAFWAGVRLISETVGTLPLGLYTRRADGGRDPAPPGHPLQSLLRFAPNADLTPVEFWQGMALGLCVEGNAYAEKKYLGKNLIAMVPRPMQPYRTAQNVLRYKYTDNGKSFELAEDKVFHIRGFGTGGDSGLSPVGYARQTIGASMAADESSARMFANGMRPAGFFLFEQTLTADQRTQAKTKFVDSMTGTANAGGVGILEAGVKWQGVTLNPHDAEMLQSRQFNVEEICRVLGVPPILIGHAGNGISAWGSGIEQIMLGWYVLGLRPYLRRIEAAIQRSLVAPEDRATIYAEFNIEGLLRADSAGRAALYSTFAQNGINTRNEIRARENLPAMPGGDQLTVQSNLMPLDKLGHLGGADQGARNAIRAWLGIGEGQDKGVSE